MLVTVVHVRILVSLGYYHQGNYFPHQFNIWNVTSPLTFSTGYISVSMVITIGNDLSQTHVWVQVSQAQNV